MLQVVDLAAEIVDLSDQCHVLLQDPHVVLPVNVRILQQLPLQALYRFLQVVTLPVVLTLDITVKLLLLDAVGHVFLVEGRDRIPQLLRLLDKLHALMQIVLEALDDCLTICHLLPLSHNLLLKAPLPLLQLVDVNLQLLILSVVILKLDIHSLDLLLHLGDAVILRVDLRLQLLDLVVQDKLEFLKFLIVFLQIVDALLLVTNGLIALLDFLLVVVTLLGQLVNPLLLLLRLLLILLELFLALLHLPLELLMISFVDTRLASQTHLVILLCLQAGLFLFLQLLDLAVRVLLELTHSLLVHSLSQQLLLDDELYAVLVCSLPLVKVSLHVGHLPVMRFHHVAVSLLPLSVHSLALCSFFLIPPHFDHHLVLE
mmetsp:Transcript_126178/g.223547  ORF Transcript_126178/g.223547 Transcript_126178/m.223547 type:complete len:372 (-) Transcript_126178:2254-3369(-)